MREAVEKGRRHFGVTEDGRPFAEAQVGGDDDAGALIEFTQEMEEQCAAGGAERQVGAKKGGDVLRGSKAVKFQYIAEYRGGLTRSRLCRLMGVTERGLYAWKHRPPSHRQRRDMVLLAHIRDQHRLSLGSYGRPRMTEELNELGLRVGQRRVGRLMRQNNIQVVRTRKFKRTTDSDHAFNIAPNLLQQDFTASGPNQKWAGDITYVWTREGWVYLAVIIDLFSRRVVGWAISNRMKHRSGALIAEHTDRDLPALT